ncbi:hypothetical protein AGMMS50276_18310 [Synergistales bacterium]|nr:hypothetical protein AGMMS50276_18310 [Synergistales bacterium]
MILIWFFIGFHILSNGVIKTYLIYYTMKGDPILSKGYHLGKIACGNPVIVMRELKRHFKKRRSNKYPIEWLLIASAGCLIMGLIFWFFVR